MSSQQDCVHGSAPLPVVAQKMQLAWRSDFCDGKPALLMLHGWGSSSAIWQGVQAQLAQRFNLFMLDLPGHGVNAGLHCSQAEEFCQLYHRDIAPQLPPAYSILGWSLGGMLGSLIAEHTPSVKALVTVATNPAFVARPDWSVAMPAAVFGQFQSQFEAGSAPALQRFIALQTRGAMSARADMRWIQRQAGVPAKSLAALASGLSWLATLDLRACYANLLIPVFHHLGAHDNLVPFHLGEELATRFPAHRVRRFENSSHLPFVSEQSLWLQTLYQDLDVNGHGGVSPAAANDRFAGDMSVGEGAANNIAVNPSDKSIDKRAVARAFSRAAPRYEATAKLQHDTGEALLAMLQNARANLPPQCALQTLQGTLLDLGAGTGYFARRLASQQRDSTVVELDLSAGMLRESQRKASEVGSGLPAVVQADFESLPFAPDSFALTFANLSLQWSSDLNRTLCDIHRVLRSGGVLAMTTLLDGSLGQLREASASLGDRPHVNAFSTEHALRKLIQRSPFSVVAWEVCQRTETFEDTAELLRSVNGIGAGNHLRNRSPGLLGRARFTRFCNALSQQRNASGELELDYRILSVVLSAKPGQCH